MQLASVSKLLTCSAREVTLAPQEVSSYRNCAFPLHEAHHTQHRKLRWNANAHVDVTALQMPFQDATFLLLRQLVKNLSQMSPPPRAGQY